MLPSQKKEIKIPKGFFCSITNTNQIMLNPVTTSDGHTYERDEIELWLKTHDTSPNTGVALLDKTLKSNFALKDIITEFLDDNPEYRSQLYQPHIAAAGILPKVTAISSSSLSSTMSTSAPQIQQLPAEPKAIASQFDYLKTTNKQSNHKDPLIKTLTGHGNGVTCLQLLPNGKLVSGGGMAKGDAAIKIWDLQSGACIKSLNETNDSCVIKLQLLPNGQLISSLSNGARIWDLQSGACLKILSYSFSDVKLLSNGKLISGQQLHLNSQNSSCIKIWDLQSGTYIDPIKHNTNNNAVHCMQLLPSGELVTNGDESYNIKIWDLQKGTYLKSLNGHTDYIACLQLLPNGYLISGSGDHTIKIWDLQSSACIKTLNGHNNVVTCLQPLPNGYLISGSRDHTIKIWNLENDTCLETLKGHTGYITSLLLSSNGTLISSSLDKTIKIWDISEFVLAHEPMPASSLSSTSSSAKL